MKNYQNYKSDANEMSFQEIQSTHGGINWPFFDFQIIMQDVYIGEDIPFLGIFNFKK